MFYEYARDAYADADPFDGCGELKRSGGARLDRMLCLAFGQKVTVKPEYMLEGIDVQELGNEFILYLHESLRPLGKFHVIGLSTVVSPFTGYHDQFCGALFGIGYPLAPTPDWIVFDARSMRKVGSL